MKFGRYTKKPVTIIAWQFEGRAEARALAAWCGGETNLCYDNPSLDLIEIETLEGTMAANVGDWIIQGVKGEFYPCKPDIFEASYDQAADVDNPHIPGGS